MSNYGPWSVKGIDDRAREVAKEQARLKGVTLGDYINELLLQGHSEAGPRDDGVTGESAVDKATLQGLADKIEAVEARSTLAITGIDKSVVGLVTRLEESEKASSDLSQDMSRLAGELRDTHDALLKKVESLESRGEGQDNLEAMKSLERALAKLASHVYEEHTAQQDESEALRGRVEAGFEHLSEHIESMEARFEKRFRETANRLENVETGTSSGPGPAAFEARMTDVEDSVASALNHVEGTLIEVQQRLNKAEQTTDTALKALEHTFASLNERIDALSSNADPGRAEDLRKDFEMRFESLAGDIRKSVDEMRVSLANEIAEATRNADPQSFPALEKRLNDMSGEVETRLTALSDRESQMLETVSERFNTLADQIDEQVASSEKRSADAIEQVGEQVAGAISRLQARQDETARQLSDALEAHAASQEQKLDDALIRIESRVDDLETRTATALSPVQRAIATLAARLDMVEPARPEDGQSIADLLPEMPGLDSVEPSESSAGDAHDQRPGDGPSRARAEVRTDVPRMTARATASPMTQDTDAAGMRGPGTENEDDLYGAAVSAAGPDSDDDDSDFVAGLPSIDDAVADEVAAKGDERLPTDDVDLSEWQPDPADPHDPSAEPDDRTSRIVEAVHEREIEAGLAPLEAGDDDSDDDDFEAMAAELDWERGTDSASDLVDENPDERDDDVVDAAAEDPFDDLDEIPTLNDPLAYQAPAGEEAEQEDFAAEFEQEPTEFEDDPDHLFGAMDDGRDESRESDVFDSEFSPGSSDKSLWSEDEFDADDDIVSFSDEDSDDALEARQRDDEGDEQTADYLNRARNAAIRATGSRSARFRAHQAGRGGVDRYSAAQTRADAPNRKPLLIGLVLFGIVAIASGIFVVQRTEIFGSEPRFLLNPAPAPEAATDTTEPDVSDDAATDQADAVAAPAAAAPEAAAPAAESAPLETPAGDAGIDLSTLMIPEALTLDAAADNGNPVAQLQLGEQRLESGAIAEGADLIRAAAENKLAAAEYRLAKLHEEGLGVPRDLGEARFWTERAAEGGNANAMHDLAVFYAEGDGGLQSYAAAAKWFRKAADFGVVDSQYNLAILYENGLGISASQEEALYWFRIAEANGDASAPADVRRLEALLDPAIVSEVGLKARSWQSTQPDPEANGRFSEQSWQVSQRAQVRAVQEALNALGYEAGFADGIMGTGTRTALQAFQADAGLTPTGEVSDAVVLALNARLVTES